MPMPLFPELDRPPQAARLGLRLHALARQGLWFGTSSWKYPGWLGSIYSTERYLTRGRFSRKRFDTECLSEFALTFPTVCGDFSFYQFPSADYWKRLFGESPATLQVALKAPEEITVAHWPSHPRYGARGDTANASFLDPGRFMRGFLDLLAPYQDRVAVVILEFGAFARSIFADGAAFSSRLDEFLTALPGGIRLAVEIRNPDFLDEPYYAVLARNGVAHVLSAWTRMPELGVQIADDRAFTADFTVVRALLSKGRTYEQAVARFEPYETVQAPDPAARAALVAIGRRSLAEQRPTFVFVNNRLEGNAPSTIEAVATTLETAAASPTAATPA